MSPSRHRSGFLEIDSMVEISMPEIYQGVVLEDNGKRVNEARLSRRK